MSTITVRRHDVTAEEVTDALRAGLDTRYDVVPGMRISRVPLIGTPRPDRPELILVSSSAMARAHCEGYHYDELGLLGRAPPSSSDELAGPIAAPAPPMPASDLQQRVD